MLFEELGWVYFQALSNFENGDELDVLLSVLDHLPMLPIGNRHVISCKIINALLLPFSNRTYLTAEGL